VNAAMILLDPECDMGYTVPQLEEILGDRMPDFDRFMHGQTFSLCDGRLYNYETKGYDAGCGPHGTVVNRSDLERFLRGGRVID
jgi:hypothetical protein